MARRRPKLSHAQELEAHRKIVVGLLDQCEAMAILHPDVPNYGYAATELGRAHQSIIERLDEANKPSDPSSQPAQETTQA